MDYRRRLVAAAQIVISSDRRANSCPPLDPTELGVSAVLKPHQLEGVSWLIRRYELGVNVILGDEMGLGKTLQAISFLNYLKIHNISPGPFLVLCPLSITDGWMSEFTKFCPNLKVLQYVGNKGHRCNLRRLMHGQIQKQYALCNGQLLFSFDVLLTTYDVALLDKDFLSQVPWHFAIIDEAQRLKNSSSVLYTVLEQEYIIPRCLLMTGTPIQNNLSELWALLHFCMPSVFGTPQQFVFIFKDAGDSLTGQNSGRMDEHFKILKHVLKAFMLRRTKALLVESGTLILPPLTEITVLVPFVPLQRKVYMSILKRELPTLISFSNGAYSHQSFKNIVVQLRKVCSHPYLFSGIEPEPYEEGEHLVQASGKLIVLDQLLGNLHAKRHRVLLFAQMTRTLDILQDFLELRKYTYERLDGSVRAEERFAAIRSFGLKPTEDSINPDSISGAFVFLISTRAGGVGLNLVAADTVIFYEQDWNPQVDKQALQRAHRIGQMNHVLSINLVTQRMIDEVIMRRAERKLHLSISVMGPNVEFDKAGKDDGIEAGDMGSLILGLQVFDPIGSHDNSLSPEIMAELTEMSDKVVHMRDHLPSDKDDRSFEISSTDFLGARGSDVKKGSYNNFGLGIDETSYSSWIEKLKEASKSTQGSAEDVERRRCLSNEMHFKSKAAKEKAEEKKLAKWEALGYHSLAIKEPDSIMESDVISDAGSVQFVYGDCTKPNEIRPSEPAIIFSCVDNSGNWGRGGMFTALSNLSASVPDIYHGASEFEDLHMGDVHLIKLNDYEKDICDAPLWVALAVVQSYNPRRKVPRSNISMDDLEKCLLKASLSAAQNSASIHMPRIGYQDGSQRSEWYTIERLLCKYASIYGVNMYIYYFRRGEF
ncbi:Putative chromatin-remodeling complex ATPase chain [Apostasia shenzhenica]|uniref:Chromatin-remodeling complex ATPase chain n=1 Tax=Apostasia shenzhenica TaxID=1088818 RepID=A0A2I0B8M0_9ASPA|nr:Putative chromatin-remodeling complex ATPase chain [Apostasia shenzhenica]